MWRFLFHKLDYDEKEKELGGHMVEVDCFVLLSEIEQSVLHPGKELAYRERLKMKGRAGDNQ